MFDRVPLAWRNTTSDHKRLRRAATGIGFAAVLILMQLGFLQAFLESSLYVLRSLDGDLVMLSSTRYQFGQSETFERRRLYQALGVPGVGSVAPLYYEWSDSKWKSPMTGRTRYPIGWDRSRQFCNYPQGRDYVSLGAQGAKYGDDRYAGAALSWDDRPSAYNRPKRPERPGGGRLSDGPGLRE